MCGGVNYAVDGADEDVEMWRCGGVFNVFCQE
jgi:hypothetical protein